MRREAENQDKQDGKVFQLEAELQELSSASIVDKRVEIS